MRNGAGRSRCGHGRFGTLRLGFEDSSYYNRVERCRKDLRDTKDTRDSKDSASLTGRRRAPAQVAEVADDLRELAGKRIPAVPCLCGCSLAQRALAL